MIAKRLPGSKASLPCSGKSLFKTSDLWEVRNSSSTWAEVLKHSELVGRHCVLNGGKRLRLVGSGCRVGGKKPEAASQPEDPVLILSDYLSTACSVGQSSGFLNISGSRWQTVLYSTTKCQQRA